MQPASLKIGPYDLTPKQHASFLTFQNLVTQEAQRLFASTPDQIPVYISESHLIRLLVARDFSTKPAMEMWLKWVEWRKTYAADKIKESDIEGELKSGKAFWHKTDKQGHPCLIVKTKRHIPAETDVPTMMKFAVHLIEKGCKVADESTTDGKVCVLWDRQGFTMKNFDRRFMGLMKKLTGVLQDNYAERLDSIFILNPNWFFKTMFKVVRPFLNQKTKDKIKLVSKNADLLKWFSSDCVMKDMGGTSDFVYKYKDWVVSDGVAGKDEEKDEDLQEKTAKEILKEEGITEEETD